MTGNLQDHLSLIITYITLKSLELGKFHVSIKHICLIFVCKLPFFYLYYTFYSGLLIFCCQSVAALNIIPQKSFHDLLKIKPALVYHKSSNIDSNFLFLPNVLMSIFSKASNAKSFLSITHFIVFIASS